MWVFFPFYSLSENHMSLTRPEENLNTPQWHQSWTHKVLCQLNANTDESPLHCQTPATWPETPTPQPGAAERARMNTCQSNRETQNDDLQHSPRRWHLCNTQDENNVPSLPECEEISRRGSLRNRVCIINSFCATDLKNYSTFVDLPCSSSRVIYYYQPLLLCKLLVLVIKLSHYGSRCNSLKVKDPWVSNVGINRPTFNVIKPCRPIKVSVILSLNCTRNWCRILFG